jgi:hypothetical protein
MAAFAAPHVSIIEEVMRLFCAQIGLLTIIATSISVCTIWISSLCVVFIVFFVAARSTRESLCSQGFTLTTYTTGLDPRRLSDGEEVWRWFAIFVITSRTNSALAMYILH